MNASASMTQPQLSTPDATSQTGLIHRVLLFESPEAPLVLLVHGRAGNAEVMWAFRRTLPEGVTILAPQAFLSDPVGGFSWWDVSTYPRGEDALISTREAIGEARSRLLSFLDNAVSHYKLAPRKVIALGFSQGAGLLSSVVQREPSRFSGVGLLAGFVIKDGEPAAFGALPPIFIGHGELDEVVPLALAHEGKSYLESRGHLTELHTDPVGHKLGTSGMRALKEWNLRVLA